MYDSPPPPLGPYEQHLEDLYDQGFAPASAPDGWRFVPSYSRNDEHSEIGQYSDDDEPDPDREPLEWDYLEAEFDKDREPPDWDDMD